MYASRTTQFIVGLFALFGIVALAVLSFKLGRISILPEPRYVLYANFVNIGGLKPGDDVDIAGVKIGKVLGATLVQNEAHVAMEIDKGVEIDDGAIASIRSQGIIGGRYISIQLGPSNKMLKNGDQIQDTEPAFMLEDVIGNLINGIGSKPDNQSNNNGGGGNQQQPRTDNQKAQPKK